MAWQVTQAAPKWNIKDEYAVGVPKLGNYQPETKYSTDVKCNTRGLFSCPDIPRGRGLYLVVVREENRMAQDASIRCLPGLKHNYMTTTMNYKTISLAGVLPAKR